VPVPATSLGLVDAGKKDPLALTSNNGAGPFAKADALAKAYGLQASGGR
jgi:hypothetical protein